MNGRSPCVTPRGKSSFSFIAARCPGSQLAASIIAPAMQTLTLTRPDDWHLHLRDGAALAAVLPHTARQFARAIVMPNLRPPVTTVELAEAYRHRILAVLPENSRFEPLMTLYLCL